MIDPWHDPENRLGRYILDADGNPVPEPDMIRWAIWLEQSYQDGSRQIAQDELAHGHRVSTVFLGLDHNLARLVPGDPGAAGPPILFETMVLNDYGQLDTDWSCERTATRAEALEAHAAALGELKLHLATTGVT